jgi:hypothetical protein
MNIKNQLENELKSNDFNFKEKLNSMKKNYEECIQKLKDQEVIYKLILKIKHSI